MVTEKSVSKLNKEVSNIGSDVINLKVKMEKFKSGKCKKCKSNSCLNGNPVTEENYVKGANCRNSDGFNGHTNTDVNGTKYISWDDEDNYPVAFDFDLTYMS